MQAGEATQFNRFDSATGGESQAPPEPLPRNADEGNRSEPAPELAPVIPLRPNMDSESERGLGATLIQLLALFKEQRAHLIRMLGLKTYNAARHRQKKVLLSKSGAILDRKAE